MEENQNPQGGGCVGTIFGIIGFAIIGILICLFL